MNNEDLGRNLRLLCSYYKSVAEVCRRLNINRPQFNRYLSGRYKPSANTMRRFCEFFDVEEHELLLPHEQFRLIVQSQPKQSSDDDEEKLESEHLAHLKELSGDNLDRYLGYYFEYYISMACPGKLLRTLVCLEKRGGQVYFQRTERLAEFESEKAYHGIYKGVVHFLSDRIFLSDYETLTDHEITQTILFPSFKNRVSRLTGLKLGVSGTGERMPCCARVLYEHIGTRVNIRKALAQCGLYDLDSPDIDQTILNAVSNGMKEEEWHFRARF